ncbi:hypothetical protein [Brumimicrobium aurantiacum]|nr:hypothetical protein [Brumimicrobium aurantiacum]
MLLLILLNSSLVVLGQGEKWTFNDKLKSEPCEEKAIKYSKFEKLLEQDKIRIISRSQEESIPILYFDSRIGRYCFIVDDTNRKKMIYLSKDFNPVKTIWRAHSTFLMTDFTHDNVNEIGAFWKTSQRIDSEWGYYSGETVGLLILDPVKGKIVANVQLSRCGSGWNMCSGKSNSDCSYSLTFELINDFFVLKNNSKFWKGPNKVYFKHDGESFVKVDSSDVY